MKQPEKWEGARQAGKAGSRLLSPLNDIWPTALPRRSTPL